MTLAWNRYGKSRIRLVKVTRGRESVSSGHPTPVPDPHGLPTPVPDRVVDLTLDIQLEGAFDPVYIDGDNSGCLATDTMKNTVYALARQDPIDHVESFGLRLADHFAARPLVSRVRIAATEHPWQHVTMGGLAHPYAFVQTGGEQWTAVITRDGKPGDSADSRRARRFCLL